LSEPTFILPAALRELAESMGVRVVTSTAPLPGPGAEEIKANINRRLREAHE
jgi:hypothetical protein